MPGCELGNRLLSERDQAITAAEAIGDGLGTLRDMPDSSELVALEAEYDNALAPINDLAYSYNEHVMVCPVCKDNLPVGPYSKQP
jgi:hypothetical protein